MRYVPKETNPQVNVNVSDEHPLAEATTLILGLGAAFALVAIILIFIVDVVLFMVPADREAELFESWLPDDISATTENDERRLAIEAIASRLAAHYPDSPYRYRIEIDDSPMSNAMAFPGGLIIVTAGLLDRVQTENELAFVIAHEIGHFRNRDHLPSMGRGLVLSLLVLTFGGDATAYSASIADLALRSFSRDQESAADEFALGLVNAEYGHVAEASRFFERLVEEYGETPALAEYVSTHPASRDRIELLEELARENGWSVTGDVVPIAWAK